MKTQTGVVVIGGGGGMAPAGWGHRVGRNIAYAFVKPAYAAPDTTLAVEVIGEPVAARVVSPCLYDPENTLLRGAP